MPFFIDLGIGFQPFPRSPKDSPKQSPKNAPRRYQYPTLQDLPRTLEEVCNHPPSNLHDFPQGSPRKSPKNAPNMWPSSRQHFASLLKALCPETSGHDSIGSGARTALLPKPGRWHSRRIALQLRQMASLPNQVVLFRTDGRKGCGR